MSETITQGAPINATHVVDHYRQLALFNPLTYKTPIHVVGVGATGSHIVDTLTNMGVDAINIYDFDIVENHNLPNQIYCPEHVGKLKVEALKEHVAKKTGLTVNAVNEKVTKINDLSGILILCTDKMASQKEIFSESARMNRKVSWVLETRMGIETGRIYFFDPNNKIHIKKWLDGCYGDEEAAESPCNLRAIASTARVIAALASHKVVIANKIERNEAQELQVYNETILSMDGTTVNYSW